MNAPFPPSDFDAAESSRYSEAFNWIGSDECPEATDGTVHEVLPRIAAELRDRFNLLFPETVELLGIVAVDCNSPPTSAEIEQIAEAAYSADCKQSAVPPGKQPASKLEWALDHAANGLPVFPVEPDTKRPVYAGWQVAATTDRARAIKYWTENSDYNIGTPAYGKLVVDIDPRNGGSPDALRAAGLIPDTWISRTQGGGWHFIYDLPKDVRVRNSTGKLGPGIDVKSGGGLILLPGSTINGRKYRWEEGFSPRDRKRAVVPAALIEAAQAPRERSANAGKRLVEEDEEAIALATHYIEHFAPTAEQGNRNNTAVQVANRLYDFGLEEQTALDFVMQWNDEKCFPPLDIDELRIVVGSARRTRQRAIGADHPNNPEKASGFAAVEINNRSAPEEHKADEPRKSAAGRKNKFDLISAAECARAALETPREWLIENVLHRGAEGVVIGAPGEGKTFGLLDMAYNVSKGTPWAGNPTRQGGVVYVAAEDQEGIKTRLAALEKQYGPIGDDCPFDVILAAPDLAHGFGDAHALIQKIHEAEARRHGKTELVIIDTLNRAIAGGDESSSKDMGSVLNAIRLIREETGAATLVAHHPGWNSDRARGHSSLFGAVDTELRVKDHKIEVHKLRNGKKGHVVRFQLVQVTIGPGGGTVEQLRAAISRQLRRMTASRGRTLRRNKRTGLPKSPTLPGGSRSG